MRISIFPVLVSAMMFIAICSGGLVFVFTFQMMGKSIADLFMSRANMIFELAALQVDASLDGVTLSHRLTRIGAATGGTVFVMDDAGTIVGHPHIVTGRAEPGTPEAVDPNIVHLMRGKIVPLPDTRIVFRKADLDGVDYGIALMPLDEPPGWKLGGYLPNPKHSELVRLKWILYATAICLIVGAVVIAYFLARMISRPLRDIALVADKIGRFELEFERLPPSRVREVDTTDAMMNSMADSLRWFGKYVPRDLVRRIMGDDHSTEPRERELTVLFTDIVDFTSMSERMTPIEVANFVNGHLSMVSQCIENEGGTVDKFIGDAVMAFFGAPEDLPDHAARACRATLAIRGAVERDNAARRAAGQPAVHLRIGIHTGPVVVGNIGSDNRINYTIIGDTVNAASRLEGAGKEYGDASDEVTILSSEAVVSAAGLEDTASKVGAIQLRGRQQETMVYAF